MEEEHKTLGCVIDGKGVAHSITGIDDFIALIESQFPELDEKWEEEWEPAGLEFYEEASEWVFENAGWIEMLHEDSMIITFEKPSHEAIATMMRMLRDISPTNIKVNGPGKPVSVQGLDGLIAQLG
jgi:hypothetical protein